jgi:sacsin
MQHPKGFQGSLFTVLPLPISTKQPVHVHGLFSLSPDRARLYQLKEDPIQDQADAKWNEWLLQNLVPRAWIELLSYLATLHPSQSTFDSWPSNNPHDILSGALAKVLEIAAKKALPLWPTCDGYVTVSEGLLNVGDKPPLLVEAFKEAHVPVVYVPERLRPGTERLFRGRILDASQLCDFLMKNGRAKTLSSSAKNALLEYFLLDTKFTGYGTLELFPFEDGKYRAIQNRPAFVPRNDFELKLFDLQNDHNIALNNVSDRSLRMLKNRCAKPGSLPPSIRYRSELDFQEYCLKFHLSQMDMSHDIVHLDPETVSFVSKAWSWIMEHRINFSGALSELWLLPLTNGQYRKIKPRYANSDIIYAPSGSYGDMMRSFDLQCDSALRRLLDTGPTGLRPEAREALMAIARTQPSLRIRNGGVLIQFVEWLREIHQVVNASSDDQRTQLLHSLAPRLPAQPSASEIRSLRNSIKELQIFKKICRETDEDKV